MIKLPYFQKGDSKGLHFFRSNNQSVKNVFFIYITIIFLFLIILFIRLFQLTIVKGSYYRTLSEQNRLREITIEAPRGEIVDRKGFVIAQNLKPDINQKLIISKRVYQSPEAVAPFIGYRQIADVNDLKNDTCQYKLQLGSRAGKKGIEKLFDCELRGRPGKKLVEVDAQGRYLKTVDVLPPIQGDKIQLALDFELQKKTYELVKDVKAAIIVTNPKTGEILTSVSSPSFNSQDFEDNSSNNIQSYLTDKNNPLFNRVTEGTYPPGSIFKLVVATAGLEEKAIDEKTKIEDKGSIKAGAATFGNWYFLQYGKVEGMVDVVKAIRRSNDIFFYKVGEKTGVEKIKKWTDIFGLGKRTEIGLDEAEGMIPSTFWKKEVLKENWYLGDTYNLSIGQGYVGTTPLQMALVADVFANGGYLCKPQLLKQNVGACKKLPISKKTIDLIREGMKQACSTGGTGWPLFDFVAGKTKIQVACKTGTAESHAASGMPHAWITAFAPYENPEISVTVLIEEGGQGSDVAGPIAKEILKAYFERSQ
ncbi:MAG: penicillin-binding transpeptidase domain-containing protein [Patescibacteria group bacterium]